MKIGTIFFTLIVLNFSCSSPIKKNNPHSTFSGVSLVKEVVNRPSPQIDKSKSNNPFNFPPDQTDKDKKKRSPIIAIILGPGGNNILAHIGILKSFEKHKIPIHMITGPGLGAVVASFYAKTKSARSVEWELYKFFSKLPPSTQLLSKKWKSRLNIFLKKSFKKMNLQDLPLNLFLPLYDKKMQQVVYHSRGPIYKKLLITTSLAPPQKRFSPSFQKEIFNVHQLLKKGADIVISIDVLGQNLTFKHGNGFLLGNYSRIISKIANELSGQDLYFVLNLKGIAIDSNKSSSQLIKRGQEFGDKIVNLIFERIDDWYQNEI